MDLRLCLCSAPDGTTGEMLARLWVERGWAACVTRMGAASSIYRWEGRLEKADEELLLVKTTAAGAQRIREALGDDHPYDCPEWIEFDAVGAAATYARWVGEQTG